MALYLCEHCFEDKELKAYCNSSKEIGTCSFTKKDEVPITELSELISFFSSILRLFEEDNNEGGKSLIEILGNDWNLFSSEKVGTQILDEVLKKRRRASFINVSST